MRACVRLVVKKCQNRCTMCVITNWSWLDIAIFKIAAAVKIDDNAWSI